MRYSDDIIEEVRMKNDIVDVVSQYVKLTRKGSSYFGLCPFHNEKTTRGLWRASAAHDPKLEKPVRYWPKLKRGLTL